MEAKDLRIGNYFEVYEKRIEQVSELRLTSIQNYINEYFEVDCKPIPLTEEWLIKFGFERNLKDGSFQHRSPFPFTVYFDGARLSVKFYQGNELNYVHQLQNLYFALTGEELTIKE